MEAVEAISALLMALFLLDRKERMLPVIALCLPWDFLQWAF
jgi:hypothetical protein